MSSQLRILHLEDNPADGELIEALLITEGIDCQMTRVDTQAAFSRAIEQETFDIIISDYSLPSFDGLSALKVANSKRPETPFIFVSGTLGEEAAVDSLQNGATDYVLKQRLNRLPAAVRRALRETHERSRRERTEAQLRESHARLQAILEYSPSIIFLKDTDGRYLLMNPQFEKLTGQPNEHIVGKTDADLFPAEEAAAFRANDQQVLEAGVTLKFDEVALHEDGPHTSIVYKFPLRDASGRIYAIGGIVTDITDRKKAEEKIRQQAALLDVAHDAIILCDLTHHILFWNKGAERMYGWLTAEALGKTTLELLYPGEADVGEPRQLLVERGEWQGELKQKTKDNKTLVADCRWSLVHDETGRPTRILKVHSDITEKKQLEKQFLRTQRMENLGTLAGGIAHDLNNVLSPILMALQLLRTSPDDPQSMKWLTAIENSAKRAAQMVKQILSFARGTEGERVAVHVKSIVAEVEKMTKETFPRSIQILTSLPSELWTLVADATQLYQVLLNLCVNARDAMPNGGTLTIRVANQQLDQHYARMHSEAKAGPYVMLSVVDTGTGMPAHVKEKIFDPFFTTKEIGKGTGLGLSTVMGIVKSHGGFVNVYSEVGKGSEFKIYLPAEAGSVLQTSQDDCRPLPAGNGELILVVDDETAILEMAKMTLEAYGYQVITALDGTEALAHYAKQSREIAVVITDMMMPFMDGQATIRALQKVDPLVYIIAVSGLMENEKVAEVAGSVPVTFLQKPYTAEKLLTMLHQVLMTSPRGENDRP